VLISYFPVQFVCTSLSHWGILKVFTCPRVNFPAVTDKMDRLLIVTFVWFHLYLEMMSNCWELLFLLLVLVFPCQRLKHFSIVSLWRGLEVIDSLKMVKAVVVGWNPVLSFDRSKMNSWAIDALKGCCYVNPVLGFESLPMNCWTLMCFMTIMSSNHEYVQTKCFYNEENKKLARRKKTSC